MELLKEFDIIFDKSSATYEPGEVVSGKIIIEATRERDVERLYFLAKGSGFVHWFETSPTDEFAAQSYIATEEYYSLKYNIFHSTESEQHKISCGHNEYKFSFRLSDEIPCSFEHSTGYVRYTLKVILVRPLKVIHERKTAFSVVSRYDLNAYQTKCCPMDDEFNKNFNCFCCIAQGSLNLQIMLPCTGFVPGQTITTTIQYSGTPDVRIRKVSTKLVQRVHFRASNHITIHKNVIRKTRHSRPFSIEGRVGSEILVPPIPPTELKYCNIIDIHYELVVSVRLSRPHSKIKRKYPLMIGTIPLYRPALAHLLKSTVCTDIPFITLPSTSTTPMHGESSASNPQQDRADSSSAELKIPQPIYKEGCCQTPTIREHFESEFVLGVNTPFFPKYPAYTYPAPRLPDERL